MFKPNLVVQVVEEACVGCNQCVNVCPSGALSLDKHRRKAVLDEPRCVGCMKCVEQCIPYGAIGILPNPDGRQLGIPPEDRDEAAVNELCAKARLAPEQVVCVCTGTTASEVAAAIADGITAPEDITLATGVRPPRRWFCLPSLARLLQAIGILLPRPKHFFRLYTDAPNLPICYI